MTWRESDAMNERVKFISDWLKRDTTIVELCRRYAISRKTAYKWIGRYRGEGPGGLAARSRAPRNHGRRTSPALTRAILRLRRRHPLWGPRKLQVKLREQKIAAKQGCPAPSTIGEIIRRAKMARRRRTRRRVPLASTTLTEAERPNHVWRADHKGYVVTGDGWRCEPLTVTDGWSRYLVSLTPTASTSEAPARRAFQAAFRRYGLPEVIRTDNGTPFAAPTVTGLTRLSVWWTKLGIRHERIAPGRPYQNGSHERFHGTLAEAAMCPPANCARTQIRRLARFCRHYNEERPHEALGQVPPAKRYRDSSRRLPSRLPPPCYPSTASVRRVRTNGEIRWHGKLVYIADILSGERIGIVNATLGTATVWFYKLQLGVIDNKTGKLLRPRATSRRRPRTKRPQNPGKL
jgi:putative transposase